MLNIIIRKKYKAIYGMNFILKINMFILLCNKNSKYIPVISLIFAFGYFALKYEKISLKEFKASNITANI